jgi:twitching motility two-component system response regulator PilG
LQSKGISGSLQINAQINPDQKNRTRVLVWQKGKITYGAANLPDNLTFTKKLVQQFKPSMSETALSFVKEKITDLRSLRAILELLCKVRVLTWEQIESFARTQAAITLEQLLPHAGQFQFTPAVEFDITYGEDRHWIELSVLKQDVALRQQEWASLGTFIPSMEAVPRRGENSIQIDTDPIGDRNVKQHIQQWIDGKRSLIDIAEQLDKDPLQIARSYMTWVEAGWIAFNNNNNKTIEKKELATILAVDDSPIIQTLVKRALSDRYNVLLAGNAVDALNLLNQKPVALLLLDVTMPDIDGLEMCRTLRSIPKFQNLPIVMLTARDTLIDKMKGQNRRKWFASRPTNNGRHGYTQRKCESDRRTNYASERANRTNRQYF